MKPLVIKTNTNTEVTIGETPVSDVIDMAAELAHMVLEELSVYRQRHRIDDDFRCEGLACEFLDTIGD